MNLHYTKLTIDSVDDIGTYISQVLRQHSTPTTQKCLCIPKFWFLTGHNNTFLFNVLPSTVSALLLNPNYWTEQQQNTKTLQVIYTTLCTGNITFKFFVVKYVWDILQPTLNLFSSILLKLLTNQMPVKYVKVRLTYDLHIMAPHKCYILYL